LTQEEAKDLLRKYRMGTCTEKELQVVNQWYQSLEEDAELLEAELDFEGLRKEILTDINTRIGKEERKERPIFVSYGWRAAAVLLMVLSAVFAFYKFKGASPEANRQVAERHSTEQSTVNEGKIILADGTKVWVRRGSKLQFPKQFAGRTREVTLVGEAFFEVEKDPSKPFIIHSGEMTTKVLGTSFNIKAYENDKAAEVTVVTGKVSVSLKEPKGKTSEVILKPNEKVTYMKALNTLVRFEEQNANKVKMIAQNVLNFNDVTFAEIASTLSTAYNVSFQFENDAIEKCVITADLSDQSLEMSLKILTKSVGAQYAILHDEVLISGKGCQ
jgi:transmembrane sensor